MNELMSIFVNLMLGLSIFPIHELGHYYSAKTMGLKANLVMKRFQVWTERTTEFKSIVIRISGVVIGIAPIIFISDIFLKYFLYITYLFGCSLDIIFSIEIVLKQFNFNLPKTVIKIKQSLVAQNHHKYCPCRYCIEAKQESVFFYRG